jgi:hypothetical protein
MSQHRRLAPELFALSPQIRYVAVNQDREIVEMEQSPHWPSHNPAETDRMEELIVNPAILELATRRGVLDLDGIRFVVIRYGPQYQVLLPYAAGHVSIGVEPEARVTEVAETVLAHLEAETVTE